MSKTRRFVSRAGDKLEAALAAWPDDIPPIDGIVVADLGANVGGFTDCLLQRGAARVYAVETGYGVLEWKLRQDERVVTMERTNALHAELPEQVDLVVIDVAWTPQRLILPAALGMLKPDASGNPAIGHIVTLVKPQYEAHKSELRRGVLPDEVVPQVLARVREDLEQIGSHALREIASPMRGSGGNTEYLWLIAAKTT